MCGGDQTGEEEDEGLSFFSKSLYSPVVCPRPFAGLNWCQSLPRISILNVSFLNSTIAERRIKPIGFWHSN